MIRLPPISTLTDTLFPYTTLFLSILVKTFNLTVDKFPIAGATIGLERGALAFVVLAALLYFTASFILYYWIDIRNVEISSHQANAEEIFKKRIDRIAWRKAEKIESKIKKRSEEHTSELKSLMRI